MVLLSGFPLLSLDWRASYGRRYATASAARGQIRPRQCRFRQLRKGLSAFLTPSLATACCARFYADGRMVLANAGQIPPYVDERNANGERLRYQRTARFTKKRAHEIVEAAQRRGQDDDVTVLSVTRMGKLQEATT